MDNPKSVFHISMTSSIHTGKVSGIVKTIDNVIYEGLKVVPYSTGAGCTLSHSEVNDGGYKEVEDTAITVKLNHAIFCHRSISFSFQLELLPTNRM